MREIKFRGKRSDNGEWVEGNYYESQISGCFILQNKTQSKGVRGGIKIQDVCIDFKVLSETVGQYICLKDKNIKDIFEGDIVECVYNGVLHIFVVVWDNQELDFKGTNGEENYGKNFEYLTCCEEVIVIGNIFDNPQLLEAKQNENL